MLRLLLAFAVTLVIGVDATNAQDTSKKSPGRQRRSAEEIFNKLDTNKDGKLSKEEFMKDVPEARKEAREKRFTAIDTNKDGTVTKEELKAAFEKTRDRQEKDGKRGK